MSKKLGIVLLNIATYRNADALLAVTALVGLFFYAKVVLAIVAFFLVFREIIIKTFFQDIYNEIMEDLDKPDDLEKEFADEAVTEE